MNTNYIVGTLFFLTGSFMLFMHRLVSLAVHHLGNFVNDTIHLSNLLYIPSILFIIIGLILIYIGLKRVKK
ncbi:hypothetical protein H9636_04635 [Ureibacillus sp. Re31]|uniref:DUF3955 domain-containing protein n=2 Tax=Bacillales TaxID=1385 RepID=A0A3M8H5B2_9BACI|nr:MULTISPECIES: hypothetical protein [Bacillales]MBD8025941.1 hypothetical protein [Ureibacillus galli]RNC97606.1 hypothetical protein EC501_14390 [Lysinibacillus halotolerans]